MLTQRSEQHGASIPHMTYAVDYMAGVAGAATRTLSGEQQLAVCAAVLLVVFHPNAIEALANGANRLVSSQDTLARGSDSVLQGVGPCGACVSAYKLASCRHVSSRLPVSSSAFHAHGQGLSHVQQ